MARTAVSALLVDHPEMALLLALALGHLIGMIRVGPVQLGELAKGQWRMLEAEELEVLAARSAKSPANS